MPKKLAILITSTALFLGAGLAKAQTSDANDDLLAKIDETIHADIERLVDIARGNNDAHIHRPLELEGDQWAGNEATSRENPLVSEGCQREAMRNAVLSLAHHKGVSPDQATTMATEHMLERSAALEDVTYSDYIAHLAECKALCGKAVRGLMACHIEAVTNLEHDLVFFDLDSFFVQNVYRRENIEPLASTLEAEAGKNILLIGRASRIGELGYNHKLSRRRAMSVRDTLVDMGISPGRIQVLAFGYEPPQISSEVADAYQLSSMYSLLGNHRINQSVMMVVY